MKKIIFSLFALVVMAGGATAQNLSVSDVYVKKGDSFVVALNFECPPDTYTGMQISIEFPENAGFSMAPTGAVKGWEGSFEYNMKGNIVDIATAGSDYYSTATIYVEFSASDVEINQEGYEVKVSGQLEGRTADEVEHYLPVNDSFKVFVNDYITLDENSQVAPKATSESGTVKVLRTLKANEWSTICLPFALNNQKLKAAFGEDVEVAKWNTGEGYVVEKDGDNVTSINVKFVKDETMVIRANTPYIIKVSNGVDEFTAESVKISPEAVESKWEVEDDETLDMVTYGKMIGTYTANTAVPENSLFLNGGNFWYSAGKTKMKAFRAYFTFKDVFSDKDAGSRIKFSLSDGDTQTEIQIPELMPMDGEYYDLKGQRVETPSKGVYIKDGKKVVVK